jgi:hypothetical protein
MGAGYNGIMEFHSMRQSSQLDRALQAYAREYLASTSSKEIDLEKFVDWILKIKPWEPDPKRIKKLLRADVSHALSEERFTDIAAKVRRFRLHST